MNRIIQVDFFRGLLLILITTNHFLSKEDFIHHFTYEFIGWVTAAEGFVFLSGLTAGMVYSRKLVEKGEFFIAIAPKKRAWTIYKYHLVLLFIVIILLYTIPYIMHYWRYDMQVYKHPIQNPLRAVLLGSILLYQPLYLDILPMYALFMLLLPFVLRHFLKGNHLPILAGSFLIYLLGTFDIVSLLANQVELLKPVNMGVFNLLSWQFLFTMGLYFGYLTFQKRVRPFLHNKQLLLGAVVICLCLFIFKQVHFKIPGIERWNLDYLASKENLGPLRLLHFFALALVMSFLASRYARWFSFKSIAYLGRYSLEVFALHILLIILLRPIKEYSNSFQAVQLNENLYFYPWATCMLFFILIPALYLAPVIKNYLQNSRFKKRYIV